MTNADTVELYEPIHENLKFIKDEFELTKLSYLSQKLYCIFDKKSLTFLPPFLAQNDEEAIRNFENLLNYSQSLLNKFPEDFTLLYIGEFVVSICGDYNETLPKAEKLISDYFIRVADGELHVKPDTDKYNELINRVNEAVQTSERVNNVLSTQLANVPNLNKEMDKVNVLLKELKSQVSDLIDERTPAQIENSRKKFFDRIFS